MTAARRVVLVTGAGHRVGRAIAVHLAGSGFDVAVHFHHAADGAAQTVEECRSLGARAVSFGADLVDTATHAPLVSAVVASFGSIDALVNSAGIMLPVSLAKITVKEWDATFNVNVRAPFFLSLAAARAMTEGAIVNLGDHLATESWPSLVAHGISKGAVTTMTRQLAVQLAPHIRVNAVTPGAVLPPDGWPADARDRFIATTPLKKLGTPADVAGAIAYLLNAPYVTGHVLVVDGGRELH